jgi:hypothetical protein
VSFLEAEYQRRQEVRERRARDIANLKCIAELGVKLATQAAEEIIRTPPIDEADPRARRNDPQKMYERLARSVRQTIAFKARLAKKHFPAQLSETRFDARCTTVLDWLDSEIAASRYRDPNAPPPGNDTGIAGHDPIPN